MGEDSRKEGAGRMRAEPMPAWAGGRKRQPYVRSRWSIGMWAPLIAVAALVVWAVLPPGLPPGPVTGRSHVIDGDTLDVANRRIRLAGIDAPERQQECLDAQKQPFPCGETSRRTLNDLVGRGPVTCRPIELDRYGRVIATCEFRGADLGEVMVTAGQAVSSGRYAALESEAKLARRGIWAGTFETPAQWRRAHQVDDAEGAPDWPITSFLKWVGKVFFR